jgi:hypothetical protein
MTPLSALDTLKAVTEQRLPFSVRWAHGRRDLEAIVALRSRCYGRHVPAMRSRLSQPETQDLESDTRLLLVQDHDSGRVIGTLRVEQNTLRALTIEASVALPRRLQSARVAEAARLCIDHGAPTVARLALFKALYLHCLAREVDWIVVAARHPLTRLYKALLFTDLLPCDGDIPMRHIAGLPHRLLGLAVADAAPAWLACGHTLLNFMVHTVHPEIDIDEPCPAAPPALVPTATVPI